MRQQHNASSDGSRKCWMTARERNRMKARFAIRQRVMLCSESSSASPVTESTKNTLLHVDESAKKESIQEILHRIVQGDRAFFSLQYMEGHNGILNQPFPTKFLWDATKENGEPCLFGEQQLLSWFGKDGVKGLEQYILALETCTFAEYAVWLKRYHVIGSLILGGINPCLRSTLRNEKAAEQDVTLDDSRMQELLEPVGSIVRQRFFSGVVPLGLSSYIIQRVVDLRRSTWDWRIRAGKDEQTAFECGICSQKTMENLLVCFDVQHDERTCCRHQFCEPCLWKDIMEHMDERHEDVVVCPICSIAAGDNDLVIDLGTETASGQSDARLRYQESREKYRDLPADSLEMKMSKFKKMVVHERDILCSTWSKAVKPSLGLTQSVRRDKFFVFVEKGSYHYVKGCLDSGIDLGLQNEYGQTALFIAVWLGDIQLARLLLHYGCDPGIPANGDLTCLSLALTNGNTAMVDLLKQAGVEDHSSCNVENDSYVSLWNYCPEVALLSSSPSVTTLIDWSSDHPGAGSFILDEFLASPTIEALIELWKSLPVEESKKNKTSPCSVRSYYCDAHGWIAEILRASLKNACGRSADDQPENPFLAATVYPHMRFLCYSACGAVLAPHVDLSRLDTFTGKRSTHSFLLYLTDCERGGETALIGAVGGDRRDVVLATVKPRRGRLLLFPHRCPHEGLAVEDVPKLLIRGEACFPYPDPEQR
jgi:2OG-Fe(II) oxygenase superfamily/Ankyrin repeats (many copies)